MQSGEDCINVLVISIPSYEMSRYWGYLYNGYSGIFTNSFSEKYEVRDESGNRRILTEEEICYTDVVYLTNIPSGHMKINDQFDPWDLDAYCGLLCINPHSIKSKKYRIHQDLYDLLPNQNSEFELEYDQISSKGTNKEILQRQLDFFSNFLHSHYAYF